MTARGVLACLARSVAGVEDGSVTLRRGPRPLSPAAHPEAGSPRATAPGDPRAVVPLPASPMRRGRRPCRYTTGARHAPPGHGPWAAAGVRIVVAEHPAERGDPPDTGRGAAGLPRPTARSSLDHPGLAAQASPAGRGASQAQRGVGGDSCHSPPKVKVSALRLPRDRTGLAARTDANSRGGCIGGRLNA